MVCPQHAWWLASGTRLCDIITRISSCPPSRYPAHEKEADVFDLQGMTLEELKVLNRDITNALGSFDSNRKRRALQEIKAVCKKYGYDLKDVVGERTPVVDRSKASEL